MNVKNKGAVLKFDSSAIEGLNINAVKDAFSGGAEGSAENVSWGSTESIALLLMIINYRAFLRVIEAEAVLSTASESLAFL